MSKPNGSPGAGGLAAVAAGKPQSRGLTSEVDALEGLLGLPEGALRRDFPARRPACSTAAGEGTRRRARWPRRGAPTGRARPPSLRSAAGGFGPAAPGRAERQAG